MLTVDLVSAFRKGERLHVRRLNREADERRQLLEYRRLLEKILVLPGFEFTATSLSKHAKLGLADWTTHVIAYKIFGPPIEFVCPKPFYQRVWDNSFECSFHS